jgi:mono/diheme cytochrome c family protein
MSQSAELRSTACPRKAASTLKVNSSVLARLPRALLWLLAGSILAALGCQRMAVQPYYRPYSASDFFPDGASARPIPVDTVPRGNLQGGTLLFTGKDENGQDSTEFPYQITREVLQRGRDRFEIYCTPCHGYTGDGDGLVVQRGFNVPPSYNADRLRQAPVGHFFDVVSHGFGSMPSYADQVPVADRWAIIAYIRALQLSQHATVNELPADARAQLEQLP